MRSRGRRTDFGHPTLETAAVDAAAGQTRERSLTEQLLHGCQDGVIAVDPQGVVRIVNPAAARLIPRLREGALLETATDRLPELPTDGAEIETTIGDRPVLVRAGSLPGGWSAWYLRDIADERARLDSLLAERARSQFLAAASRRLGLSLHPTRTARAVVELAVTELADVAMVLMPSTRGSVEWFAAEQGSAVRSGQAAANGLPERVTAVLAGLQDGPLPLAAGELAALPWTPAGATAAAAIVELPGNGHPAGALVLLSRDPDVAGADEQQAALVEQFCGRAGIALAAATLYAGQARTVALLRSSLLQPSLPSIPGAAFGAAYRPADEGMLIGGDFYEVIPGTAPTGPTVFLLGDVCGKGVDAAVGTGRLRQSIRALRRVQHDPIRLLETLNTAMLDGSVGDAPDFVTLVLGEATPTPQGGLHLRLAGGGHPPPVVVRTDGSVEPVEIGGMLVGAVADAVFRERTVELGPGDACVLYTDGVTEARGGRDGTEQFGEERLTGLLRTCSRMPAAAVAERIEQHATQWLSGSHHDDIAVLVVQAPLPVVGPRRHLHAVHDPDGAR